MPPKKKKKQAAIKATLKASKSTKMKKDKVSTISLLEALPTHVTHISQHPATTPADNRASTLLRLPLEVRRMIYHYALATPELEIGERRSLRPESIALRYNRFTLVNFNVNHFALFAICKQIRAEIQESGAMGELSFKITSDIALEGFLGIREDYPGEEQDKIDDQILFMLQKARSIVVYIIRQWNHWVPSMGTVGWLGATLEDPTTIKLVDSAGKREAPAEVLNDVVARWKRFAETL